MDDLALIARGNGFDLVPGSAHWTQTVSLLIAQSIDPAAAGDLVREVARRWPGLDLLTVAETVRDLELLHMEVQAIREAQVGYVPLPDVLAGLRDDRWCLAGLPWGRAHYRTCMYELNEAGEWVYTPVVWTLAEVLDQVEQPEEAGKGLVILAGLVVPLLAAPGASGVVPAGNRAARRAAARKQGRTVQRG